MVTYQLAQLNAALVRLMAVSISHVCHPPARRPSVYLRSNLAGTLHLVQLYLPITILSLAQTAREWLPHTLRHRHCRLSASNGWSAHGAID